MATRRSSRARFVAEAVEGTALIDFVMEQRMLRTIKRPAEAA